MSYKCWKAERKNDFLTLIVNKLNNQKINCVVNTCEVLRLNWMLLVFFSVDKGFITKTIIHNPLAAFVSVWSAV